MCVIDNCIDDGRKTGTKCVESKQGNEKGRQKTYDSTQEKKKQSEHTFRFPFSQTFFFPPHTMSEGMLWGLHTHK